MPANSLQLMDSTPLGYGNTAAEAWRQRWHVIDPVVPSQAVGSTNLSGRAP